MTEPDDLILASASPARFALLTAAGLSVRVQPADIDEDAVKTVIDNPITLALRLASEKALAVSRLNPDALVIGADQVLAFEGEVFSKAEDLQTLRRHLTRLRGRTHELISAAALAKGGTVLWQGEDRASLTMRSFSDTFMDDYIIREGTQVLSSVGGYHLEGRGIHLFDTVKGHTSTVLGLPLLALLAALRNLGSLAT
ncbi:MAG: Maf family protein [Rhodospirillales bacterium]